MKKLVAESLAESIKLFEKAKLEKIPQPKSGKPKKVDQSGDAKAKEAITGLKKQLADAKKTGAFKTTIEKNAKIKELEGKIKKWEAKLK